MSPADDDNFFSRWSRRKVQVRQESQATPPAVTAPVPDKPVLNPLPAVTGTLPSGGQLGLESRALAAEPVADWHGSSKPEAAAAERDVAPLPAAQAQAPSAAAPKPTLADVDALTSESDFSRFLARDVDTQVKNSAMKKLFADPHFNVMDGLDTYIDDYNTPDPLPRSILRQLVHARTLGLLDDELEAQPLPARAAEPEVSASAVEPSEGETPGDNTALASQDAADPEPGLDTAATQEPADPALPSAVEAAAAAPPTAAPDAVDLPREPAGAHAAVLPLPGPPVSAA